MSISDLPRWRRVHLFTVMMGLTLAAPLTAESILKFATLAPEGSSWVTALRGIDKEIRVVSEGQMRLKIYAGGVQGDEEVMLRKIRIGQLQGVGLGGSGLSGVLPEILALEMPFLFDDYDEIDHVLLQTSAFYRQAFLDAGFTLLGWSDIGFVYFMSQQPVRSVDDLRGRKVWRLQDEPLTGLLFKKAGVMSVPLTIPDVLLGLQTNLVDVVYASPSAAIVLQWFTRVKNYTDLPINYAIGAFLLQRKVFEDLPQAQQQQLLEVSARHIDAHNLRSRTDNADALQIMQREGVVAISPAPGAVASFQQLVLDSTADLVGHVFSREAHEQVQRHLAEFRADGTAPAGR
jgi:TRAP-type transport system periplasmic protein